MVDLQGAYTRQRGIFRDVTPHLVVTMFRWSGFVQNLSPHGDVGKATEPAPAPMGNHTTRSSIKALLQSRTWSAFRLKPRLECHRFEN